MSTLREHSRHIHGTFRNIQGTFRNIQGTFSNIQGTFSNICYLKVVAHHPILLETGHHVNTQGTFKAYSRNIQEYSGNVPQYSGNVQQYLLPEGSRPPPHSA
jgi:hypothetical protein